ncbi:MFS transporter [Rhizobium sp. CRIBSB]|nr:MFS transporter [Rhizobium sp. CRIBSB]
MSQTAPVVPSTDDMPPVSARFVLAYTAAQIGAYIGFVPLLTLLLPLKAAAIDAAGRVELLATVALWGAITAGVANVIAGAVSDRTHDAPGRRWRWMAAGVVATALSYGLIAAAQAPWSLMVAIVCLQIGLNLMLNPLAAILPDLVPDRQKGLVSGFAGTAYPLASLFGALVIGVWLSSEWARLCAVVLALLLLVFPFVLSIRRTAARSAAVPRDPGAESPPLSLAAGLSAFGDSDFRMAFVSRLFVQTAVAMNVLYLLFFLQQETGIAAVLPAHRPEAVVGWLLTVSTVVAIVAGLVGGYLSDRLGRRRELIFLGGLCLGAAALVMALVPQWPGPVLAQGLFGIGMGIYGVVDTALIAQVLPSRADTGRDLGLINVATTAAQVLAPLLALIVLQSVGNDLRLLFAISGAVAVLGASTIMGVRRVR